MNTPYTRNTKEVREFLEKEGFTPLSFYQGKKYIYPLISNFANVHSSWKVRDYSTFDDPEEKTFLVSSVLDFDEFRDKVYEM